MTLQEAQERIGDGVVYETYPDGPTEDGVIVSVNAQYVMVKYVLYWQIKATRPEDLQFLTREPVHE